MIQHLLRGYRDPVSSGFGSQGTAHLGSRQAERHRSWITPRKRYQVPQIDWPPVGSPLGWNHDGQGVIPLGEVIEPKPVLERVHLRLAARHLYRIWRLDPRSPPRPILHPPSEVRTV